jgi:hypothetical protein
MSMRVALTTLLFALAAACDSPTRERVDRWRGTVDGAQKLAAAVADADVEPSLRGRAAAHLVALGEAAAVMKALGPTPPPAVVEAVAAALWSDARIASELQVPTPGQVAAKDALFDLRAVATGASRDTIDTHLTEWVTGFYEGRADLGRHRGDAVLSAVGARAAPPLRAALDDVLAAAAPDAQRFTAVHAQLLAGLSLAGAPGIATLLDLTERKLAARHPDETLRVRAIAALHETYVRRARPTDALVPFLPRLAAIAGDVKAPPTAANMAFDLIAATRAPHCLPPLAGLAAHPDANRVWVAVTQALACGGADAIVPIAEALRADREYDYDIIEKYLWGAIAKLGAAAAPPARALLGSSSWLARLTGVQVLAAVGDRADAARLRDLQGDGATLRTLRGSDTKGAGAATLGEVARRVADKLEQGR